MFNVILWLPRPVQKSFEDEIVAVKDEESTLNLMIALACNSSQEVIKELWQWFGSAEYANKCGFDPCQRITGAPGQAVDDTMVAQASFRLLNVYMGFHYLTNLHFTDLPPNLFLGLVSSNAEVRSLTLARCKSVWVLLGKMEASALTCEPLQQFVRNICFPIEQFTREVFITLEETEFEWVPTWLAEDVKALARVALRGGA